MQCMNLDKFPATFLSIRGTIWTKREFYLTKLKHTSRENVLVSHEDSFWLTFLIAFCLCATYWIQRNQTYQKELPGMEQSAYNAEPRLTTIFVFLRFIKLAFIQWPDQSSSLLTHTHTHALIQTLVCPLHRK